MIKLPLLFPIMLLGLLLSACSNFKEAALYPEKSATPEPEHIGSFYSLNIYKDFINSEQWISPNNGCLTATVSTDIKFAGKGALHLQWDKGKDGCPWLGAGFGWDNWASKNVGSVLNEAAIQFQVRTEKGTINGLPLAASIEDYSGVQAWIGMSPNTIKGGKVSEEWTTVTLPFSEFEYESSEIDLSSVKQFIIQFEAEGNIYVDEMKIVPFKGSLKKRFEIQRVIDVGSNRQKNNVPVIDGNIDYKSWDSTRSAEFNGHKIQLKADSDFLYLAAIVKDESPLKNDKKGKDLWNGDAIEIALSSNPESPKKRKSFLFSDYHIVISASSNPVVWDFKNSKEINAEIKTKQTSTGYVLEAKIPLSEIGSSAFINDQVYGLEIAVDVGNTSGNREIQHRWNSGSRDGFYKDPSLWGEMIFKSPFQKISE